MTSARRPWIASFAALATAIGCGGSGSGGASDGREFPPDFRLGVATAAEQIEGGHEANDWYQFTHLERFEGLHNGWSGAASDGYARFDEDAGLVADMGLDAYRMSIEWSLVMPERRRFDEGQIAHYAAVLDANRARGIELFVTLHHFTNPIWLLDLTRTEECPDGASDSNLCGWTNPDAPRAFADYCARMGAEYGDRVDHWATFNELNNYLQNAYMVGGFPPGRFGVTDLDGEVIPVARGMLEAHARCYDALVASDLVDADGDGEAVRIGMTWATQHLEPADPDDPAHVEATELAQYTQHRMFIHAVTDGRFDRDLDGTVDESHPEWAGRLDWVGVQYYSTAAVVPSPLPPPFTGLRCSDNLALGLGPLGFLWLDYLDDRGCPPAPRLEFPLPGYEGEERRHYGDVHEPEGLLGVLAEFAGSHPGLPIFVTENGYGFLDGTDVDDGLVRARSLVRHLDVLAEAVRDRAIPVSGYFHWTLMDNYEWNSGNRFRIGLYRVDYDDGFARSPTEAARVYGEIARARGISDELRARYGGSDSVLAPR